MYSNIRHIPYTTYIQTVIYKLRSVYFSIFLEGMRAKPNDNDWHWSAAYVYIAVLLRAIMEVMVK